MAVLPLQCPVQHYAWGSKTSIPKLIGASVPQVEPWAEMWMGAHPKAPSRLPDGTSLEEFISNNPATIHGSRSSAPQNASLSFLFKILAAESPLSIQCHPNKAQAEAGFAAEEAAGIPRDAAHRNYRDPNHKPELIVALEEFWALQGFREPGEIASLFRRAGMASAEPLLDLLEHGGGLEPFFAALLALDPHQTKTLLGELARGLANLPTAEARWSQGLLAQYPTDQGATAALVLQLVKLEAGQGLYLDAGELHAYLRGTGLELMANSDNVLRGGLTDKHVDPRELLRVLRFEHRPVQVLAAREAGLVAHYETPSTEFALSRMTLKPGQRSEQRALSRVAEIWLNLGGDARVSWPGHSLVLGTGEVAFVSADTEAVAVEPAGELASELWIAGAGASPAT